MSCHPKTTCRFPGEGQFPKSDSSQRSLTADMSEDIPELRPEVTTGLDAFLQDHFIPPIKLDNSSVTPAIISPSYHQHSHSDLQSAISHSPTWQPSTQRTLDSAQHPQTANSTIHL